MMKQNPNPTPSDSSLHPDFEAVIGLEVHCQLSTQSKIFCGCSTHVTVSLNQGIGQATQNQEICPVCAGHPGTLPRLNRKAVEYAIQAGLATHCEIRLKSIFSRKSYFYPDLPKGYQISQFDLPLCEKGFLEIETKKSGLKRIRIQRIHLEEDAGKNIHMDDFSLINLNRAGMPLIEIVSEPDMKTSEEAGNYLRALHGVVTYLGICDGNMQEGNFRCDINLSVMPRGSSQWGTRTEIKNVNSFRFVEKAIESEMKRHIHILQAGGKVTLETRTFDPSQQETIFLRSKGEANDYRYFPEPDLLPLTISQDWVERLRASLPELPEQKKERYQRVFKISAYDAGVLISSRPFAEFFEKMTELLKGKKDQAGMPFDFAASTKIGVNLMTGELARFLNEEGKGIEETCLRPESFVELILALEANEISYGAAKQVLGCLWKEPHLTVQSLIEREGLKQISDVGLLEKTIEEVLEASSKEVASYRSGKQQLFGFFVGQVMKKMAGKANPVLLSELVKKKLSLP